MSNAESKKNILRYVCIILASFLAISLFFAFRFPVQDDNGEISENEEKIFPFSDFCINYSSGNELSFSGTVTKESFFGFLREKGVSVPGILRFLPEEVFVECTAQVHLASEEKGLRLKLLQAKINEIKIPKKLLSDIGEINLDFKRSLVYN